MKRWALKYNQYSSFRSSAKRRMYLSKIMIVTSLALRSGYYIIHVWSSLLLKMIILNCSFIMWMEEWILEYVIECLSEYLSVNYIQSWQRSMLPGFPYHMMKNYCSILVIIIFGYFFHQNYLRLHGFIKLCVGLRYMYTGWNIPIVS